MVSVGVDGGQDIVYSKRFGLTGMTGTFSAAQIAGITAVGSSTAAGLPAAHNLAAAAATGAAAIGGEMYTVPYHLQTGLIKYAPIQPMPGTKITAKTPSMMNPSTSFTIFKTYAPPATITYTATESQTFTASSRENPVSPDLLHHCFCTALLTSLEIGICCYSAHRCRYEEIPQSLEGLDLWDYSRILCFMGVLCVFWSLITSNGTTQGRRSQTFVFWFLVRGDGIALMLRRLMYIE